MHAMITRAGLVAGLALAVVATTPAKAQKAFEGVVVYQMSSGSSKPMEMTYNIGNGITRIDMDAGGQKVSSLMDMKQGRMVSMMHGMKRYMVMDLADMAKNAPEADPKKGAEQLKDFRLERTGKSETIAGHSCDHFLLHMKEGRAVDMCLAEGMGGGFMGMSMGNGLMGMGRGRAGGPDIPPEVLKSFKELSDRFMLKMETMAGGKAGMTMVATRVTPQKMDPALFEIPAGYQEMKMPGIKP